TPEVAHERKHDPLEGGADEQDLERHRSSGLGIHEPHVADNPAGFLQQGERAAQVLPRPAGAVGRWWLVYLREDFGWQTIAVRLEKLQLARAGQAFGGELGVR